MGGIGPDFDDDYDFPYKNQQIYKDNLEELVDRSDTLYGRDSIGEPGAILDTLGVMDPSARALYTRMREDLIACRTAPPSLSYAERFIQSGMAVIMGISSAVLAYQHTHHEAGSVLAAAAGSYSTFHLLGSFMWDEAARFRRRWMGEWEDDLKRRYFHKLVKHTYPSASPAHTSNQ